MCSTNPAGCASDSRVAWLTYSSIIDDDRKAEHLLSALRWPNGIRCLHGCPQGPMWAISNRRCTYECGQCRRRTTLTSGTLLEGTRLRLALWVAAAEEVCEGTYAGVCVAHIEKRCGVSHKSAGRMADLLLEAIRRIMAEPISGKVYLAAVPLAQNYTAIAAANLDLQTHEILSLRLRYFRNDACDSISHLIDQIVRPGSVLCIPNHRNPIGNLPNGRAFRDYFPGADLSALDNTFYAMRNLKFFLKEKVDRWHPAWEACLVQAAFAATYLGDGREARDRLLRKLVT